MKLSTIAKIVGDAVGDSPRINHVPMPAGDPLITSADCSKATQLLGWYPRQELRFGITTQVQYQKSTEVR